MATLLKRKTTTPQKAAPAPAKRYVDPVRETTRPDEEFAPPTLASLSSQVNEPSGFMGPVAPADLPINSTLSLAGIESLLGPRAEVPTGVSDLGGVSSADLFAPAVGTEASLDVGTVESDKYTEDNSRFSRAKLDPTGQKLYDQLVQQRTFLESGIGADKTSELYARGAGLTPDASLAMMAEQLASTGITDIYKVKKEEVVQKVPIQYGEIEAGGEGASRDGYYYLDPRTKAIVEVSPSQIKDFQYTPGAEYAEGAFSPPTASGFVEVPKTQLVNTETGQPLTTKSVSGIFGKGDNLISDSTGDNTGLGEKKWIGATGVEFTPEGIPTYFSVANKEPSSWVKFRERVLEPVTAGIAGLVGGPGAAAAVRAAQVYHDTGDLGDAAKAAALSYAGSQLMAQFQGPDFNVPSPSDFAAMEAVGFDALGGAGADLGFLDAVSPGQIAGAGAGLLPGEAGIQQILANAGPDLGFLDSVSAGQLAAADSGLLPGEAGIQQILSGTGTGPYPGLFEGLGPDNFFGEPSLEELTQMGQPPVTPPTPPDLSYLDTGAAQEAAAAGTDTGLLDGTTPPVLGDPTSVAGGTPIESVPGDPTSVAGGTPIESVPGDPTFDPASAAETQLQPPGGSGGTFDPASAAETQIDLPGAGEGIGAVAALQAFAATPLGKLALSLGGSALLNKVFAEQQGGGAGAGIQGWSGEIPKYTAVRERVPLADTERRPGEYGRRYFSDTTYVPMTTGEESAETNLANIAAAKELAQQQAQGLASIPTRAARPVYTPKYMTNPSAAPVDTTTTATATGLPSLPTYENEPRLTYGLPSVDERLAATNFRTAEEERLNVPSKQLAASPFTAAMPPVRRAAGGLMGLAKGRYLNGTTDGMEDKLRTTIDGEQPAALSHGEFVIPADVVSHLGNGNSQAGAKRLYEMMDRIRQARTGTKKQGKQINANKYLPV